MFWAGLGQDGREREDGLAQPRERWIDQPLGLLGLGAGGGRVLAGERSEDPGCPAQPGWFPPVQRGHRSFLPLFTPSTYWTGTQR